MDDAVAHTHSDYSIHYARIMKSSTRQLLLPSLLAILYLMVANPVAASSVQLVDEPEYHQLLRDYAGYWFDERQGLDIEQAIQARDLFAPITTPYINFGAVERGRMWIRVEIQNAENHSAKWRLDVNRQYYDTLDIFLVRSHSAQHHLDHSSQDTFYDRPIKSRLLGADIELAARETAEIFLAVTTKTSSFMPLSIGNVEAVLAKHAEENTINWMLNGALLTCIAFTLMMISILGWRISVSFSLYILVGLIYVMHTDGYTFQHIWPQHMSWNDPVNLSLIVAMPVFGLSFARQLFGFRSSAPRFDLCLQIYILLALCVVFSSFYIFEFRSLKILGYLFTPLGSILQLIAAVIAWRLGLLGARPYLIGAVIIMVSLLYATSGHAMPGYFDMDATLDFGHIALFTESMAFAAAITVRLIGLRDERDRAQRSELRSTQEKLRLTTKLQNLKEDFIETRRMADQRREQLSNVSHDIQQPLASLRIALNSLSSVDEEASKRMHKAFDYLEELATQQLTHQDDGSHANAGIKNTVQAETFLVSAVLDNVVEIFKEGAEANGIKFHYQCCEAMVRTDPIGLMRIVSNLVSNSIEHGKASGILLAGRLRGNCVRIEVWDEGVGMSAQELERIRLPNEKGEHSDGHGLGLPIVAKFCRDSNLEFSIQSHLGNGTLATITLPLAD